MVITYLALVEIGKRLFFRTPLPVSAHRSRTVGHRIHRRAARFSTTAPLSRPGPAATQNHNAPTDVRPKAQHPGLSAL
jgi:hypothetical protein